MKHYVVDKMSSWAGFLVGLVGQDWRLVGQWMVDVINFHKIHALHGLKHHIVGCHDCDRRTTEM